MKVSLPIDRPYYPQDLAGLKIALAGHLHHNLKTAALVAEHCQFLPEVTNPRLVSFLRKNWPSHFISSVQVVDYLTNALCTAATQTPELLEGDAFRQAAVNPLDHCEKQTRDAGLIAWHLALRHRVFAQDDVYKAVRAKAALMQAGRTCENPTLVDLALNFWPYHLAMAWVIILTSGRKLDLLDRAYAEVRNRPMPYPVN